VPIIRGDTSRGVHVRAVWEALTCIIDAMPDLPSDRRVRLRTVRAGLERAYAAELSFEIALAQQLAEEDGDAVSEAP